MTISYSYDPPINADEATMTVAILERVRTVFAWKTGGLDRAALSTSVGVSSMTIAGLIKHMARVEEMSLMWKLTGGRPSDIWIDDERGAQEDWEWTSSSEDSPEELYALWEGAVLRSREVVADLLSRGDLGQEVHIGNGPDHHANMRRVLLDMIDEYARHNGHADLIRETIDGVVGEDPPEGFGS